MSLRHDIPDNFFNLTAAYRACAGCLPDFYTTFVAANLVTQVPMDKASIFGACIANYAKVIVLEIVVVVGAADCRTTANIPPSHWRQHRLGLTPNFDQSGFFDDFNWIDQVGTFA